MLLQAVFSRWMPLHRFIRRFITSRQRASRACTMGIPVVEALEPRTLLSCTSCCLTSNCCNHHDQVSQYSVVVIAFGGLGDDSAVRKYWGDAATSLGSYVEFKPYKWTEAKIAFKENIKELTTPHKFRAANGTYYYAYDSLVVLGYSYGGQAAEDFTRALAASHVSVDEIVTVDPRHPKPTPALPFDAQKPFTQPCNNFAWDNFYQDHQPFLGGARVKGRTAFNTELTWTDFSSVDDLTPVDDATKRQRYDSAHSANWIVQTPIVINDIKYELNAVGRGRSAQVLHRGI